MDFRTTLLPIRKLCTGQSGHFTTTIITTTKMALQEHHEPTESRQLLQRWLATQRWWRQMSSTMAVTIFATVPSPTTSNNFLELVKPQH